MVSNITLAMIHDRLHQLYPDSKRPFGGVSVLVFGDLAQLPPIGVPKTCNFIFNEISRALKAKTFKTGIGGNLGLWQYFGYTELTQNVRQRGDETFVKMLKRIRVGHITKEDIDLLQTRVISKDGVDKYTAAANKYMELYKTGNKHPVCLFPKRAEVQVFNSMMLEKFKVKVEHLSAIDYVGAKVSSTN